MALKEFAKEVGVGENKHILLVLDQAGWHTTSGEVELPEGIHLEFLPTGSPPELQPAERLWPLTNEAIANRLFEQISQIEDALVERWVQLCSTNPKLSGTSPTTIGGLSRHDAQALFNRIPY